MGNTGGHSRREGDGVYMVQSLPVAYDLETATTRPLSPRAGLVLYNSAQNPRQPPRRSQSLDLQTYRGNRSVNMSSKWRTTTTRKDILDRKAYYMGRFQTKAINEANLDTLRRAVRQAKMRKTRIKISPLGFSYGTKPGGLLNTDKVAYQFVPLEDIQTLRLDSIMRDVLLCIFRIDQNRNIQSPDVDGDDDDTVQHYEINAFHMEPKDAVLFQRAHDDFKSKGPFYQQAYKQEMIQTPSLLRSVDPNPPSWTVTRSANNNNKTGYRSERDLRLKSSASDIYRPNIRGSMDNLDSESMIYVRNGAPLLHSNPGPARRRHGCREAGTNPRYPATSRTTLTTAMGHSSTNRVYFNGNRPMADVECQVSDTPRANGVDADATPGMSYSEANFRSRTSSQSTNKSRSGKDDSVRRRIDTLSREMEQLRSILDGSDADDRNGIDDILEESSSTDDSTDGPVTRVKSSSVIKQQNHAGTINTQLGQVDVVVGQPNRTTSTRQQDGYVSDGVFRGNRQVRRRVSDRSRAETEVGGRYTYYRPVIQEPTGYRARSRSTEPPRINHKRNPHFLY